MSAYYGDDVINSRDIIEEIEEYRDSVLEALGNPDVEEDEFDDEIDWLEEMALQVGEHPAELDDLINLLELEEQASGVADWEYGEQLIHDSYFTDYVRELCRDIGIFSGVIPHWLEIDWDATAENIKVDYTDVTFNGDTYWIRDC